MKKLVRLVRLNGLQYNANRDPQAYRRVAGAPFRIEALIEDGAPVRCTLRDATGKAIVADDVSGGATFAHDLRFDAPGAYVVTLDVERGSERFAQDLRLDVLAHAWVG